MARPKPDIAAIQTKLLDAAEAMLEETDGRRLILSEVARRVGLTQSHAHSFFATKNDLVRALAQRWFAEVEQAVAGIPAQDTPMAQKLEDFVLAILRLKRAKYDANPGLFQAYLTLAAQHRGVVIGHTIQLTQILSAILSDEVPRQQIEMATDFVNDATTAFRVPHMIALNREGATDARARRVVAACVTALRAQNS